MPAVDRLRIAVAVVIVIAWVADNLAGEFVASYSPRPGIQIAMMAVAGWLFTTPIVKRLRNGNGKADT